jgi:hypothetical protein
MLIVRAQYRYIMCYIPSVDAYIARIAIRIMSDTRDEEKDRKKIKGVLQDTQDPRTKN